MNANVTFPNFIEVLKEYFPLNSTNNKIEFCRNFAKQTLYCNTLVALALIKLFFIYQIFYKLILINFQKFKKLVKM
jgi:hypothetical protein